MKHNGAVIAWMSFFFLIAQLVGLLVVYQYIDAEASSREGSTQFKGLNLGGFVVERPQIQEGSSFAYIMAAVLIGTGILLLLVRWNLSWVWKCWFGLAIMICLGLAFAAFVPSTIAAGLAAFIAILKVFRPNWWIQTLTELFMYSGLAVIFVPIMNLFAAIALLVCISLYDMYAVWKSKHMIALAKFQAKEQMFAGLVVPYAGSQIKTVLPSGMDKGKSKRQNQSPGHVVRTAILGGGDIGFPLLFAGVILKEWGVIPSLIIPFGATVSLIVLFLKGEDGKFYPAMPFISLGCLIGLVIAWLII